MKVLFSIFLFKKRDGGHFYSLRSISNELFNKGFNVHILVIGFEQTDIFYDYNNIKIHSIIINKNPLSLVKSFIKTYKLVKKNKFDVLHAFDQVSFFWLRIVSNFSKAKLVLNKCGGPSNIWYPKCKETIVFTHEDQNYFLTHRRFKKNSYYLIPNRISELKEDIERVSKLKCKYNQDIQFVKISRFSILHKKSILQAINLIKKINELGYKTKLLIIGKIEDDNILNEVIKHVNKNIFIETDDYFTKDAASLIKSFDYVIGSGRSLMEGAALSKVLLCSNQNLEIPILINDQNWENMFFYNFSSRSFIEKSEKDVLNEIIKVLETPELYKKYSKFSFQLYEDYFSVKNGIKKYIEIYNKDKKKYLYLFDNILQFLRILYKLLITK